MIVFYLHVPQGKRYTVYACLFLVKLILFVSFDTLLWARFMKATKRVNRKKKQQRRNRS